MSRFAWAVLFLAVSACTPPLEPSEAEQEAPEHVHRVRLSEVAIQGTGIEVAVVERGAVGGGLVFPAEVRPDPTTLVQVAPMVSGRVMEISVLPGDAVVAGQTLVVLDSADAADVGAALAEARARLGAAEAAMTRLETLGETGVASHRVQVEAQAERDRLRALVRGLGQRRSVLGSRGGRTTALVAPVDAVVFERIAHLGDVMAVGDLALTLGDPRRVWIVAQVPELRAAGIRAERAVLFRPAGDSEHAIEGTIARVAPQLDPRTRTLEIIVPLETDRLRPFTTGTLELAGEASGIAIASSALVRLGDGDAVFTPVADDAGVFEIRRVRVGRSAGGRIEILEGLSEGDVIVTAGAFSLLGELLRGQIGEE